MATSKEIGYFKANKNTMGLVKTRRLAAMQKQQRAKAGMRMKALPQGPFSAANKMRDAWSGKSAPSTPKR